MRIVFMGTPEFAVASLDKLLQHNFNIVGVVTAPDRPAGRGQQLQQSAVKEYALAHQLKVLQPEKLKDPGFIEELRSLHADLQIVVAFRMLPEVVWNMPRLGTFNLHASLLPKYRGAAPINWAIIRGEKETGLTTFRLKHEVDTGAIFMQHKLRIGETTTAGELHDLMKNAGAALLLKTVKAIDAAEKTNTDLAFMEQDDSQSTHAPKIYKETCRINWSSDVHEIYNLVRGLSPYPGAFTIFSSGGETHRQLKIFRAQAEKTTQTKPPGTLYTDNKTFLKVHCTGGMLDMQDLQLEGKKRMQVKEFLRGFSVPEAAKFI